MEILNVTPVGDINPAHHDGGFLVIPPQGDPYVLWLQHSEEPDDYPSFLYRVDVPDPVDTSWWARNAQQIADCTDHQTLLQDANSPDPFTRFNVIWSVAAYHGWESFDDTPVTGTSEELYQRMIAETA